MSDLERFLQRGVDQFDPSTEEGLDAAQRRVRGRQRRRWVLAGALTLAMFGGTLVGAVSLGDRSRRPITGPTAGPTSTPSPAPSLGEETCNGPFRGDLMCVKPTGDVVLVGSGEFEGIPWAMYAWTGTYVGPEPGTSFDEGPQPDVEVPVLCTAWTFGERRQPRCQGTSPPYDSWSMALVEMPGKQTVGIQESGDLMFRGSSGTFMIDPIERPVEGLTAVWSWTPAETSRVTFTSHDGRAFEADLFGPVAELGNGVKWFVAFVPTEAGPLAARAVDQGGVELWHHQDPPIPTETPERAGYFPRSSTVTVAEGRYEGGSWKLLAFTAIEVPSGADALCLWFEFPSSDDTGRTCTELDGSIPGGALGLDMDGDGPLPMFVYGFTTPETDRVEIEEGGEVTEASLYPAPPELGLDLELFIGFTPRRADVTIRAFGADDEELWSEVKPYHPD
jgi:hypothetical protein